MDNVHDLIIATLSNHSAALTITEIASSSGVNRHAVARHLDTLELLGKVRKIQQGNAKKYFRASFVPVSGLIDISSDLIIIVDKNLVIQYINNAAERKLGLIGNDIVGERIDMLHTDIFSSPEVIEGLKTHSPNKVFRTQIFHPDGTIYSITILELSLEIGKSLISITAEDITDSKRVEQEILESEEKYKALFKANADPIFLVGQDSGTIVDVNKAACDLYGYSRDDFLGMNIVGIAIDPDKTAENIQEAIPFTPLDYHMHRSGRVFPVELSTVMVEIKGVKTVITTTRDITKRLMVEDAIRQIRRNFETFFNTTDDFLFVISKTGVILEINRTVIQRLGYSREHLLGSSILNVHPPERQEEAAQIMDAIMAGVVTICPVPLITKNGEIIPVKTKVTLGEWNGKPAFFGVCKDISQKTTSEEKYRAVFNASPDAVFLIHQKDGRIIDANPSASRIYGYKQEELLQMKNTDLSAEPEKTKSATKNPDIYIPLRYHRHKSGTVFPVEITASSFTLKNTAHIIATIRDITERLHMEDAKRASDEIFRLIPENINEVFWIADVGMNTNIYISPGYEKIWGRTQESLYQNPRSFLDAIHEDDRDRVINQLEVKKQGLPFDNKYRVMLPDGQIRWIRDRGFPIKDKESKVIWYAGIAMDITDTKPELVRQLQAGNDNSFD